MKGERDEGSKVIILEPNATREQVAAALFKLDRFFFGITSKQPSSEQEASEESSPEAQKK